MKTIQSKKAKQSIVFTRKARCRDCYRCVRVCPVQAIKMESGQAQVIAERCIACGTCIVHCPQGAKTYVTDYERVLEFLSSGDSVALSIAPSYVAYYSDWEQKRLASAMRLIGYSYIAETAIGAWETAISSKKWIHNHPTSHHICTACPAVVSYVKQYSPENSIKLVPVVSPMVAHGRLLKQTEPDRKVVFVGPCIAKKKEASINRNHVWIDAVLTFEELDEILNIKNIRFESCEESSFDAQVPGQARLFPLEGGLLKTAGIDTDLLNESVIAISGFESVAASLRDINIQNSKSLIIEPLFCSHGCINGPSMRPKTNPFINRQAVIGYSRENPGIEKDIAKLFDRLDTRFDEEIPPKTIEFPEWKILEALQRTGKHAPEDELNCRACGYDSCRLKAIAVLSGKAEPEMCMPYMRRKAEQKFETMIACDPNGIVLLDKKLEIVHMNAAFKQLFSCTDAIIGRNISYLIDPVYFEKIAAGEESILRQTVTFKNYHLVCHQILYGMPEENQFVGVFINITDLQINKEKLNEIKAETIMKARELMDHQINMAQELAQFLGENTAKGEVLMSRLIELMKK